MRAKRLGFNPEGSEISHDFDAMFYRDQSDTKWRIRRKPDSRKSSQQAGEGAALLHLVQG